MKAMKYEECSQSEDQLAKRYEIKITAAEARDLVDEIYAFLAMQTGVNFIADQPKEALEKRFGDDFGQRVATCLANQCADKVIAQERLAAALEPEVVVLPDLEGLFSDSAAAQDEGRAPGEDAVRSGGVMQDDAPGADAAQSKGTLQDRDVVQGEGAARDVSFVVDIRLKPTLRLSSYDPVEISISEPVVSDAMVDREIDALVRARARYVPDDLAQEVTEHTVNIVTVDTKKCGMQVDALTATKMMHQVGDGRLPREIDDQLLGMLCGSTKEFSFTITSKNFLGMSVEEKMDCILEVSSIVKKEMPEVTDEWVRENIPGAHDKESLRRLMKASIGERMESEYRRVKEESAVSALARRLPEFDVPDSYYDYARAGLLQNVSAALSRQDMTEDEFFAAQGVNASQFMAQMHVRAAEVLRQGLALDAYAAHAGITVEDEDLWRALKGIAPGKEDQTRKMLEMNGRMYQLNETALRAKTRGIVAGLATSSISSMSSMPA